MKRSAPSLRDDTPAKRPCISAKYPALRAPPQRRLQREMAKAFQGPVTIGTSRLERLPPEIRNQIYELVLVDKDIPLKIRHQRTSDHGRTTHALTQVSRLIRHESTQMYYWANTFAFRSLQDLEFYLATITPDFRFVKRIELSEGVIEVPTLTRAAPIRHPLTSSSPRAGTTPTVTGNTQANHPHVRTSSTRSPKTLRQRSA